MRNRLIGFLVTLVALLAPGVALAGAGSVRVGDARFEVLTPTLIRMEFAHDQRFDNAPTLTTGVHAMPPAPPYTTRRERGWLVIRTSAATLRYRLGSGRFSPGNVSLTLVVDGRRRTVTPVAGSHAGNLGGWTRALDNESAPVPLNPGVLSKVGWYVVDDTDTVLLTGRSPGFAVRRAHTSAYQDWYLFAYGHDYFRGLSDLRTLTGPAPLLPRSAFGVWFSRYHPYSETDYHRLLAQFRAHRVPLDTLSIDTDFKRENNSLASAALAPVAGAPGRPYSWNGWEWDAVLFAHPQRFIDWAHGHGLSLAINIHPSIDTNDPRYSAALAQAGRLAADHGPCAVLEADPLGACMTFDWTNARQLAAYFALQQPFARQGIDVFWLDWCCDGPQPTVAGLTPDTWINSRYQAAQHARGTRWPAFSRIGGAFAEAAANGPDNDRAVGDSGDGALAEHRSTIQFTGDTCATWPMLAFEAELSAEEGNIGMPYVSDDIGSYNGVPGDRPCGTADYQITPTAIAARVLPDDLYARWVQLGTFQPLDRLHSNHGARLPWEYGSAADKSATSFLQLREALNPYIYTLAWRAFATGVPITGGLYLQWPGQPAAYKHPSEYTFGPNMVVAPVTASGDPAPVTAWIPPGQWIDYFTGRRYRGPATATLSVPLSRMPVFVRAGAIIPTEPRTPFTPDAPSRSLIVTVYPGAHGRATLYDDAGAGFGYQHHRYTLTKVVQTERGKHATVTFGAAIGHFRDALAARSWEVRVLDVSRPQAVTLRVGRRARSLPRRSHGRGWTYDASARTLSVDTGQLSTGERASIVTR